MYTQCLIRNGNAWDVIGLPTKFAHKNKSLIILGREGWIVDEVYNVFYPKDRKNYFNQFPSIGA